MKPSSIDFIHTIASTARCTQKMTYHDLVEFTGILYANSPKPFIAIVSYLSFKTVEVPCAFMYEISEGLIEASCRAKFIALGHLPKGAEAVR